LDALPQEDLADLKADLQTVELAAHQFTQSVGSVMSHVDFPVDAVLSVVATLKNGDTVAALNSSLSRRTAFCQVRGKVLRMSIERFEHRMGNSVTFARLMRRNVQASLFTAQQFTACNTKHSLLQRCARWLSMTADRVGSTHFTLTHDFLSIMLGVRRAGVSEAADALQKIGAITYRHGRVIVLDPDLLNATACECYEACKHAFAIALLG
jgi:CRP-like cAMP-binding protein